MVIEFIVVIVTPNNSCGIIGGFWIFVLAGGEEWGLIIWEAEFGGMIIYIYLI